MFKLMFKLMFKQNKRIVVWKIKYL